MSLETGKPKLRSVGSDFNIDIKRRLSAVRLTNFGQYSNIV